MREDQIRTRIAELRDSIDFVGAELRNIDDAAGDRSLNDDETKRWQDGEDAIDAYRSELADLERRQQIVEQFKAGRISGDRGDQSTRESFNFHRGVDDALTLASDRSATTTQLSDGLLRSIDGRDVDDTQVRTLLKRHRYDTSWTRNLLARSSDAYAEAWQKYILGHEASMSQEQRTALSIGTNANGGFLVPTHLDPTVILTNDGSTNAVRRIARVVTLTEGNVWNGVTSAGVTASWDGELVEVSDDSPTFGNPSITCVRAQSLVQASIEAFQDINGLASDVMMMFADARDRLEGAAHCTGSGSGQPTGIFTALDANTNVEVTSTTAATIGLVDLQAIRSGVGQRWRNNGTWLTNPTWADAIRALGSALGASFSVYLPEGNAERWLGRPVIETDDAPETVTTTVADNRVVFGDFSNYVIVDKPGGTSIEFIPHMFNSANVLPDGRRAWYMNFRSGADSVNDVAFRLLQDKTSA